MHTPIPSVRGSEEAPRLSLSGEAEPAEARLQSLAQDLARAIGAVAAVRLLESALLAHKALDQAG